MTKTKTHLPPCLAYHNQQLCLENVVLDKLAETYGTPLYVYSRNAIEKAYKEYTQAFAAHKHLVCYAVKANSNLAVLQLLARLGSGFDIVSVGELERVLYAGGSADKVVFSGVGKTADEIRRALEVGIKCFNVESVPELYLINDLAASLNKKAPVSIRVNPDIDAKTHPYIATGLSKNKFGIAITEVSAVCQQAQQLAAIDLVGIDCHIGSQILDAHVFTQASEAVIKLINALSTSGIRLRHIDFGGGLGIDYRAEQKSSSPKQLCDNIMPILERELPDYQNYELIFEPGRFIVGNAGVLLTQVLFTKSNGSKHFAIVDAAMNDLLRPALYQAEHRVIPLIESAMNDAAVVYDIVGPVCETGDYLAKDCVLRLTEQSKLAILSAGAYGFVMASNYNSRPKAAEVLVDGDQHVLIRAREELGELWARERLLTY